MGVWPRIKNISSWHIVAGLRAVPAPGGCGWCGLLTTSCVDEVIHVSLLVQGGWVVEGKPRFLYINHSPSSTLKPHPQRLVQHLLSLDYYPLFLLPFLHHG